MSFQRELENIVDGGINVGKGDSEYVMNLITLRCIIAGALVGPH